MTSSICFKCGTEKNGAFFACPKCVSEPKSNEECALSLVLSSHLSSTGELSNYREELLAGHDAAVPLEKMDKARHAMKDPQLLGMLGVRSSGTLIPQSSPTQNPSSARMHSVNSNMSGDPRLKSIKTSIQSSPFALLGATVRDDRRRILQLSDERSLELNDTDCQRARSDLTNPRTRLSAEIAWLPGVSPRKVSHLLDLLGSDPMAIRAEVGLSTLAQLNVLAAAFETLSGDHDPSDIVEFIQEIAQVAEGLDPSEVMRDINDDRIASGFQEVRAIDQIEAELTERRRYCRTVIKGAFDRLDPATLVQVMTDTIDAVTFGGEEHAPELIDELVDSYEIETKGLLEKEAENVGKLIQAIRDAVSSGETAVQSLVVKLESVARNWDKIAQPIQVSAKARGIDHEPSRQLAYEVRSLAIDLFNEHDMLAQSKRLTNLLQELFAEVPDVADRVEQDADALSDIIVSRKQVTARKEEWEREISYSANIGLVFKENLSISPDGISWKGQRYALGDITRVRWGGISQSVNGIPTGTTYTIAFGNGRSEAVVDVRKKDIFSTFIEKLWRAVGVRILGEMIESLKGGDALSFGGARIRDDGITIEKRRFFGANEELRLSWAQVNVWSANGSFYIGAKDDKKAVVALSYVNDANTHILEQAIRMAFKKPGMRRLSDFLQ